MFEDLSNYSVLIQLIVGSVFIAGYFDRNYRNLPLDYEIKKNIEKIKDLYEKLNFDTTSPKRTVDCYTERSNVIRSVLYVLAVYGGELLFYCGVIECNDSYHLFRSIGISIPTLLVSIFMIAVTVKFGHRWEKHRFWRNFVIWSSLFFVFLCLIPSLLHHCYGCFSRWTWVSVVSAFADNFVPIFNGLSLVNCVAWFLIRYFKSKYLLWASKNKYKKLEELCYKYQAWQKLKGINGFSDFNKCKRDFLDCIEDNKIRKRVKKFCEQIERMKLKGDDKEFESIPIIVGLNAIKDWIDDICIIDEKNMNPQMNCKYCSIRY